MILTINGAEELLKEINKSLNSIHEAEKYAEDYSFDETYQSLTDGFVNVLEKTISDKNAGTNIDLENDLSDAIFSAWRIAHNINFDRLNSTMKWMELITIDVTELRNLLVEQEENFQETENLFNKGLYQDAINNLRKGTKDLVKANKKWSANKWNNIGNLIKKGIIPPSVVIFGAIVYVVPTTLQPIYMALPLFIFISVSILLTIIGCMGLFRVLGWLKNKIIK